MVINLDANASCSLLPEIREFLGAELQKSAGSPSVLGPALNPSAVHRLGQRARALVEQVREEVRLLVKAPKDAHVVFCSGATEANNHAVAIGTRDVGEPELRGEGADIVISAVEHPATKAPVESARAAGALVREVPVLQGGDLDQPTFLRALGPRTKLVSLMLANNETGVIFPIAAYVQQVRERAPNALFHTDAVQAIGKMPVSFTDLAVDTLALSGHKIGAPAGIGALVVSPSVEPFAFLQGGAQESRWRGGTENVVGIVCLGIAARVVREGIESRIASMRAAREELLNQISQAFPDVTLNGSRALGLPNTLSLRIPGCVADDLVVALDMEGVCISSGAACSSGKPEPSHVLRAMGLTEAEARSTIRISVEPMMPRATVQRAAHALVRCITHMRGQQELAYAV